MHYGPAYRKQFVPFGTLKSAVKHAIDGTPGDVLFVTEVCRTLAALGCTWEVYSAVQYRTAKQSKAEHSKAKHNAAVN
jgi:hypothetical protein